MTDKNSNAKVAGFPVEIALRDGTTVLIRPIRSADKHLLEVGIEHMSKESRYFRFFQPVSDLSEKLLSQFTDIDHVSHEAIGAVEVGVTPANPLGVARYIQIPKTPTIAEVAVTVIDSHQGKGLGTLLLAFLAHRACEKGITEFSAIIMNENYRMLQVFKELGATTTHTAAGEIDIRIPLHVDPARYPNTPVGNVFKQVSEMFKANLKVKN